MPRKVTELTAQALVQLVKETKDVNNFLTAGRGSLKLRCPCGAVILPSIAILPNLTDRQRGHLKWRIERHLRRDHRLSGENAHVVLKEAFATD